MLAPENIVILTGAGISAESGLATFRGGDGLWCGHRVEDVATPEGFQRNPALVHAFYNTRRRQLRDVIPNAAHHALARLAAEWRGNLLLVTQNVDDLHDRAGHNHLLHMHGELNSALCTRCGAARPWRGPLLGDPKCPACARVGGLRPDIVWFGEMPYHVDDISAAIAACDLFVSIGTSGAVYPAAGFVQWARDAGARTLELNLEPSAGTPVFDEARHGPASVLVPAWVEELLAAR